ncbi:MAG: DUF4159 domain-containing protein [Litorimonas sp.]
MSFAGLTFLAPLVLLGLLTLPIVWWILRISPPKPRDQIFPPLRILEGVQAEEETPAGTPLWLLIFRLLMVALVAFALAQPILKSTSAETQSRPTLLIDQSVFSAPNWDALIDEAERLTRIAQRNNLEVSLIPSESEALGFRPAREALETLKSLQPVSYVSEFDAPVIESNSDIYVLTSGLSASRDTSFPNAATIFKPEVQSVILPSEVRETPQGFDADWYRPSSGTPSSHTIEALGTGGGVIASEELQFGPGADLATVSFNLPAQLRSRVARLRVSGVRSAASIKLLDDSFGRPLVGVLRANADTSSPLLTEPFYAKQALLPFADVFEGDQDTLLALKPSILVMPDSQRNDDDAVKAFVEEGGILIRFAGARVAKTPDTLLPVALRVGDRAIGGALAWESPQKLAPFSNESPFAGLEIPEDVTVSKQVMAEPGIETDTRTWARLEDGSPIVTSAPLGQGRVILFHVTAGPEWSNLALSGLYVDMLQRLLPLAKGRAIEQTESTANWIIDRELDPFGRLQSPPPGMPNLTTAEFETAPASSSALPGTYRQGTRIRALSVVKDPAAVKDISFSGGSTLRTYGETSDSSLMGKLLGVALFALALDALFALMASGRLSYLKPVRGVAALVFAGLIFTPDVMAQDDTRLLEAATGLHLAYIETGDVRRDELSRVAMEGLKEQLSGRTTIEPVGVHGVTADMAGLEMYPFLYWPIRRDSPSLSPEARLNINAYMASGGTIVFDTGDEGDRVLRAGDPHPGLKRVSEGLDIPRLTEVPSDHVLTKSFYLLQVFPGRWANGPVYVQAAQAGTSGRDGVSSVIIGSNDWAAGWAVTNLEGALVDLEKDLPRQREISIRFGVNIAMYALSGNYKSDQVHAAALVERLGEGKRELPGETE